MLCSPKIAWKKIKLFDNKNILTKDYLILFRFIKKNASEYDQEMPRSQTADQNHRTLRKRPKHRQPQRNLRNSGIS